jgi:hypothetical protein
VVTAQKVFRPCGQLPSSDKLADFHIRALDMLWAKTLVARVYMTFSVLNLYRGRRGRSELPVNQTRVSLACTGNQDPSVRSKFQP